jgi:hypothetical protein
MTGGIDDVRAVMSAPEDVDVPPELAEEAARSGMSSSDGNPPTPDQDDPGPDEADLEAGDYEREHGGGDEPPSDDRPDPEKLRKAALLPINDLGNGQRFVLHFGDDVIYVPRVGWHVWDGRVWQIDPDMIKARAKAFKDQHGLKMLATAPAAMLDMCAEQIAELSASSSKQVRAAYEAKLTELDFKQRNGELVSKTDVDRVWFEEGRRVRDAVRRTPQQMIGDISRAVGGVTPEQRAEVLLILERHLVSTLEGLSGD